MKTGYVPAFFFFLFLLSWGCTGKKPGNSVTESYSTITDTLKFLSPGQISPFPSQHQSIITSDTSKLTVFFAETIPEQNTDDTIHASERIFQAESRPAPEIREESLAVIYERPGNEQDQLLLKKGRVSQEVFFLALFDNDIFDYTDYYYTNGISLQLYHPAIGSLPLSRALPGLNNSLNYYGILITQNMYTPLKLEDLQPRESDRPFASYLTLTHQRISLSPEKLQRLQTEFTLGVLGPASGGNLAQDLIHSNTPVGWVNQVDNTMIVNYLLRFDQGIIHTEKLDVAFSVSGQAGTLYDNIAVGTFIRFGRANDLYGSIFQATAKDQTQRNRFRYYAGADLRQKFIVYDATLQGGMFGRDDIYSIDSEEIERFVFTGSFLFGIGLGRYSLEAEQVYVGPEFSGGRIHFWFRIKNIIRL